MRIDRLYLSTSDQLAEELCAVIAELCEKTEDLATVRVTEAQIKSEAYATSSEPTTSGRDRAAQYASRNVMKTLRETEAECAVLSEKRDLIRDLLRLRAGAGSMMAPELPAPACLSRS